MKSMMPRFFGVFLLLSHEARVRVTSLQLSDTGLPGLAKKANHALQLEVSRMLQDGDALAAFHQFRVFLEFQEHRGKLSKCSCAAEKSGDAVITASGGIDQHAPDVEQPEHSKQGLAQGFPDPETMILHTAVSMCILSFNTHSMSRKVILHQAAFGNLIQWAKLSCHSGTNRRLRRSQQRHRIIAHSWDSSSSKSVTGHYCSKIKSHHGGGG